MEYATFKTFRTKEEAEELQAILSGHAIESSLVAVDPSLGAGFGGELLREYEVKLDAEDFAAAHKALEEATIIDRSGLPEGYYLLDFSTTELMEVIAHHDEWSDFDYLLARQLLKEQGHEIEEKQLQEIAVNRLHELAKPEQSQGVWIAVGYIAALLGGLLGLIAGYVLLYSRKTLPTGIAVPTYSPADRRHGRYILWLSIFIIIAMAGTYVSKLSGI